MFRKLCLLLIATLASFSPELCAQTECAAVKSHAFTGLRGIVRPGHRPQAFVNAAVKASAKALPDDGRDYETVIEEDFSLFTAGSVDDPDKNYLEGADEVIPSRYTHTPGWKGRGVMSAGAPFASASSPTPIHMPQ